MFKFIRLLMVLLIGVSLFAGCGGGSDSDDIKTPLANTTDSEAPKITMNGKSTITIVEGSIYTDAGATAKDAVDGTVKVTTKGTVNGSKVGTYTITYTAVDKAGNKSTKTRTVKVVAVTAPPIVVDKIAPVITLKGDVNVTVVQGTKYTDAGATAKDNIDGIVKVTSSGSVDSSKLGTYTITYTAIDKAGNRATKTRTVNVILPLDTTAPVITISGDNPLEVTQGETFADPGATATDDRDGILTVTPTGKVVMDTEGSYEITYTATDKAGNKTTAIRTVIVKPADVVWEVSNMSEFRQALEDAAANGDSDRIVLAKGTYNVTSDGLGTLTFDDNEAFDLIIEAKKGLTSKDVILDGNNSTQIFNFNNTQGSTLILKNISVVDANTTKNGAVYTNQNIKVEDCTVSNNIASSGGGFYSNGTTAVTNSTISNNSSRSYSYGGGFYSARTTTVTNSTISNNKGSYGGGFHTSSAIINNSTIKNNNATNGGGFYSSSAIINNSTINNNNATNSGGGFYTDKGTVTNSIFSENNATRGATFYSNYYSSYISNNTFVKNRGSIYSKGIFVNNIFSENDEDINLQGESKIYNNYIDYNKIEENGHNVIKKSNLQYSSVGEVYLTSKYALESESPVIDKGLNPSSATFKKIIGDDAIYTQMLELLKTDNVGNKRVHNSTVDMGAVEFGSSK